MLSFLAIGATISCEDNDEELFINNPTSQLMFKSTAASSYILTFETKNNLAERLVWTPVTFDTPISVDYEVQASNDPANFDNAIVLTSTNDTSTDISVERLNDISAELGLTPFSQGTIAMRVVGRTADSNMAPQISDALVLVVTPYTTESPKLWVPGNFSEASGYGANYAPGDANTPFLQAVEFGSTEFEGFVFMNVASPSFKFTPEQSYDVAYGGDASTLSVSGGDLSLPGPGYYYITVSLDPNSDGNFDDAIWSASAKQYAIIGAATPNGWNDPDTNLTYNVSSKKWEKTLQMMPEKFKFRANDDWGNPKNNFGVNGSNAELLDFNGSDLTFSQAAGLYKVELDLSNPRRYTYSFTAQ